jgi:MFS family permease
VIATLRQRNFALLWVAGLISWAGAWAMIAALTVYVFERTGSTLFSGLIWLSYPLSGLLFGSVAGVYVDRWDRRRTMVAISLLQALLIPCLQLGFDDDRLWIIYVVAFVEGSLSMFFAPAESALLPRLVGEDRLVTANALNALNDNLARIAGPAIGGLLLASGGFAGVVLVDAASYLVAALLIVLIAVPGGARPDQMAPGEAETQVAAGWSGVWNEWVAGLRLIRADQALQALLLVIAVAALADSLISPSLVPFVVEVVAGGTALFGILMTVRGIAGLLGGLLVARLGEKIEPPRLFGWSLIALSLGFFVVVNVPVIPVILVMWLALGPAVAGWLASQQTLIQTSVEDPYRGRFFGAVSTIASMMALAGISIGSALGEVVGVVPILNVAGLLYASAGVLALVVLRGWVQGRARSEPGGA